MGMTVFAVFRSTPYTYLTISQSNIAGDVIVGQKNLMGVYKERGGMVQTGDLEIADAKPTLHVHPEDFDVESVQDLVGNGVEVNGQTYAIEGATAGTNFETGEIEHYTLTLTPARFTGATL